MNISKTKRNFIGLNTLFAILSAGVGAVILHVALPGHYFGGYPFIPTYFYLFGLFSIYMFDAKPVFFTESVSCAVCPNIL